MSKTGKHSPFSVLPLGIGDAFSRHAYPCSMLLLAGETTVLVDCPDPIHRILAENTVTRPTEAADIDHIILTHLHGDHSNGLESFLFYRRFLAHGDKPRVYALPEVLEDLWPRKLEVAMRGHPVPEINMQTVLERDDLYETQAVTPEEAFEIGPMRFEIRRTLHSVPTFGLRVTCEGKCFGYSCDTAFDPDHIAFLERADLIFHDCGGGILHANHEQLATLPEDIRKKIHVLHLHDDFDRDQAVLPCVVPGKPYAI